MKSQSKIARSTAMTTVAAVIVMAALTACSPHYPDAPARQGLCVNNCNVSGKPAMDFYSKFMTGTVGSCADQANMSFTSAVAQFVMPKDDSGFAQMRLYIDASTGLYTAVYATPVAGTDTPVLTKVSHPFYLSNDKIVFEELGIGRRGTDDEMILQPLSSSSVEIAKTSTISFVQDKLPTNEKGETVAQVCAAQSAAAPAPVSK